MVDTNSEPVETVNLSEQRVTNDQRSIIDRKNEERVYGGSSGEIGRSGLNRFEEEDRMSRGNSLGGRSH